jgi:hypothetical protein
MVICRRNPGVMMFVALFACTWLGGRTAEGAVVLGGTTDAEQFYAINFEDIGDENPVRTFTNVPGIGDLTVSFGTHFLGQTRGSTYNSLDDTVPTNALTLDPSGNVRVMFDFSAPTMVMLGGVDGPGLYTTPLSVLFSDEVSFVALDLGYFDDTNVLIEVYDSQGNSLGVFDDLLLGHNRYTLSETTGQNVIGGLSVYVPNGMKDTEGFGLNNLQVAVIPEPATLAVWSVLIACVACAGWWQQRRVNVATA